jgi:hypothetical protein
LDGSHTTPGTGRLTADRDGRTWHPKFYNWYYQLFHFEKLVNHIFSLIGKSMLTKGDSVQYGWAKVGFATWLIGLKK